MVFLATVDPSPRPQPMKFPVFSPASREFWRFLLRRRVSCEPDFLSLAPPRRRGRGGGLRTSPRSARSSSTSR